MIRVFPRRTNQTPTDVDAYVGGPHLFARADTVHISVAFTWDLPEAEHLAESWSRVGKVEIGGPATGAGGGDFVPGRYLRHGNVITSRGCPGRCWFCSVPDREGPEVRELPIADGWVVQDDNLLACSEGHVRAVFAMLKRQPRRAHFAGGLEASRLEAWHVELLRDLKPRQVFFSYDTPSDLEPLRWAGERLLAAGFTRASHTLRCYVLIGFPGDTILEAERRLNQTMRAGFMPMGMLWRDEEGRAPAEWAAVQRCWCRPAIMARAYKEAAP